MANDFHPPARAATYVTNVYIAMKPVLNGRWAYMLNGKEYTSQEFKDKAEEIRLGWQGAPGDSPQAYTERFRSTVPSWTFVPDGSYRSIPQPAKSLEDARAMIWGEEDGYILEVDTGSLTVVVCEFGQRIRQ